MTTLTERMKKYAELGSFVPNAPTSFMWKDKRLKAFPEVLADLQTTVRALEVAREALDDMWNQFSYNGSNGGLSALENCESALETINQTLGKADVNV